MITVRSTINIAHQSVPEVIPVVQGDTGRSILFTLADFTIPTGATARYFVMKPSGLSVYNDATIDGNTVLVDLTAQSLAEYGDCPGQVRISVGDTVVTSFEFILHVEPFRGIDAVESTTETNIFDKAVDDAREAIAEAAEEAEEYISQAIDPTLTIPDKAADAKATGAVIAQMRAEIANVYPTETAQGNPATFDDGADGIPVKDLKVSIVPTQDLHGYDHPWPAGGGKNLLPNENTSYTEAGVTFTTLENGKIRLNGTSTGSIYQHDICENYSLPEGNYVLSYDPVTRCSVQVCNRTESAEFFSVSASTPSRSFTVTSEMVNNMRVRFLIASGVTFNNAITGVMIRKSTDSATFEPYSNLCPITGMTEVGVENASTNKAKFGTVPSAQAANFSYQKNTASDIKCTKITSSSAFFAVFEVDVKNAGTYRLATDSNTANISSYGYMDSLSGTSVFSNLTPNSTVTLPVGKIVIGLYAGSAIASGTSLSVVNFRVNEGSSALPYEDYHYQDYTIPLGRTVYGGTPDITTGDLSVTMASVDMGTLTWSYESSTNCMITNDLTNLKKVSSDDVPIDAVSPISQVISASQRVTKSGCRTYVFANSTYVLFRDTGYTDATAFKASVNGLIFVYAIATPQTYTLTPQELLSVLGTNHISTDAESVDVVYRQDIGLILKRMSDSLLPYLPLTRDGIYDLKAEVTGGEKSLYWWTQAFSMMSSARPMQTPIAPQTEDEIIEESETLDEEFDTDVEDMMDDIEENEEE